MKNVRKKIIKTLKRKKNFVYIYDIAVIIPYSHRPTRRDKTVNAANNRRSRVALAVHHRLNNKLLQHW